jgi:hypothetical protein
MMPRSFILSIILLVMSPAHSRAEIPRLFRETSFNSATLAAAVNHFVAIGEEATVKELVALSAKPPAGREWVTDERIGWVCRILFAPKGQKPLRPPMYGALAFVPDESMPPERWPLFPVALSGETYFVLGQGYSVEGVAEPARDYVAYCRENGIFRRTPVLVPTRAQAVKDAAALERSAAWQAIQWKDASSQRNASFREDWLRRIIRSEVETIPNQRP